MVYSFFFYMYCWTCTRLEYAWNICCLTLSNQQSNNHFLANTSDAHTNGVQINMNMHSSITSKYNKLTQKTPKSVKTKESLKIPKVDSPGHISNVQKKKTYSRIFYISSWHLFRCVHLWKSDYQPLAFFQIDPCSFKHRCI